MNNIKNIVGFSIIIILAIATWMAPGFAHAEREWEVIDLPVPDVIVYDEAGDLVDLVALSMQKPLVLNLWASWCSPCLAEMPSLATLAQHPSMREDVIVYALNVEDMNLQKASALLQEQSIAHPALLSTRQGMATLQIFKAHGLPMTFILYQGRMVVRVAGELDWTQPAVRRALAQMRAES